MRVTTLIWGIFVVCVTLGMVLHSNNLWWLLLLFLLCAEETHVIHRVYKKDNGVPPRDG